MRFLEADEYGPRIETIYSELRLDLESCLPGARIEHIGSSAIAGAISKGDLDVFVGVRAADFQRSLRAIKGLQFSEKEGTLRTDSLCMLVTEKYDYDVAVQLVVNGSEFENFLRFRDLLNSNPALVLEYNRLKRSCEGLGPDAYRREKASFIQRLLGLPGV